MTRRGGRVAVLVLAALVAACAESATPAPPPTAAEARAYLDRLVALVSAGDLETFCEVAGGACGQLLRHAQPARVPTEPPLVTGTRVVQPRQTGTSTWESGGLVLELCGRDGLGEIYVSELLVVRDGAGLRAIAAPYWLGIGIARDPIAGDSPGSVPTCP